MIYSLKFVVRLVLKDCEVLMTFTATVLAGYSTFAKFKKIYSLRVAMVLQLRHDSSMRLSGALAVSRKPPTALCHSLIDKQLRKQ